ncbi:MAG: hypothetical protein PHT37_05980 [Candidatus Cloacimonetes bacterium]|nr:hypothetical protein [Candidatus Cloacimonadota bacterium]MDD3562764.1 hypothetical protein [Candidatus Cloacimonadota bacterium]MDD4277418.1 hypothetical protein [Candidatus Cloacimonadota bacterium]MDY0324665.1 hypothetical protein [Candidatus Cloacimonadaceae bacterium]
MSRKYLWYILMLALILVAGCAEKNTSYQDADALTLLTVVPVVGDPQQLDCDDANMYVSLDQGGLVSINLQSYTPRWYSEMSFTDPEADPKPFYQSRKLALVPEHNRLFLNEITATDMIWIIDTTDPDSLKIFEGVTGGTSNIQDITARSIPNPTTENVMEVVYCSGNNIIYKLYDGELWLGDGSADKMLNLPTRVSGVELDDNYIYGAAEQRGLVIYNKTGYSLVCNIPLYGVAQKLVVRDGYAYVACRQGGLQIVDVRNLQNPVKVAQYLSSGHANEVDYHNGIVALSSGGGGAYVFDVRNPAKPILIKRITEVGYCKAVKFIGDVLAVASRDDGIFFYKMNK